MRGAGRKRQGAGNSRAPDRRGESALRSAYSFAILYLGLRNKEQAIDELERGYREGAGDDLFLIKVDPMLDDLHGKPRFESLVKTILAPKL